YCHFCITFWSKPIAAIAKLTVKHWCEDLRYCLLNYSVDYRRYSQETCPAIWFRDLYSQYWLRFILSFSDCLTYFLFVLGYISTSFIYGHPIDSSRTFVFSYLFIGVI